MSNHPHRVHEKSSYRGVLDKIVDVGKTADNTGAGVADSVLKYRDDVAVNVAVRVLPDPEQKEESSRDIQPSLSVAFNISLDDPQNLWTRL